MALKRFSEIFDIIRFPSGETHLRTVDFEHLPKNGDTIFKRCITWEDVMHLIYAHQILKTRYDIEVKWYVPFLPFARQDRITGEGHGHESKFLSDLFTQYKIEVVSLDVHSQKEYRLPWLYQICQNRIVRNSYPDAYRPEHIKLFSYENLIQVVPDSGAMNKIPEDSSRKFIACVKKRDPVTGKLSGFEVLNTHFYVDHSDNLIVVDDICDGGGTFIGIAQELKKKYVINKLILYVTHGIFSKGFDELLKYYDGIITTNSVKDFTLNELNDRISVIDCADVYKIEMGEQ